MNTVLPLFLSPLLKRRLPNRSSFSIVHSRQIRRYPKKGLRLCKVAPLSCLPIHSVAQRIFRARPSMSWDHATVFA